MTGMFCFDNMFKSHIKDSKLKMPADFEKYDPKEYPNFHLFMLVHLGNPICIEALEDNANIIADIPAEEIETVTFQQLFDKGLVLGSGNIV